MNFYYLNIWRIESDADMKMEKTEEKPLDEKPLEEKPLEEKTEDEGEEVEQTKQHLDTLWLNAKSAPLHTNEVGALRCENKRCPDPHHDGHAHVDHSTEEEYNE